MASPDYADLTIAHYAEAYEWLTDRCLQNGSGSAIPPSVRVFEAALLDDERGIGDFLPEGIPSPGFLPAPVLDAARWLGIPDNDGWRVAIAANYKIDLERRNRIGFLGERALVELLTGAGCSVYHGSLDSDALGWDIMATHQGVTKRIEAKSTTSIARLRIYLSRHEYEVSRADPNWLLVVVLITEDGRLERLAHVRPGVLMRVVPNDAPTRGRWQVCSIDLQQGDLIAGLPFENFALAPNGIAVERIEPAWWPAN